MTATIEKDIIMTGYAALGGISYILNYRENDIRKQLPAFMINNAAHYVKEAIYGQGADYEKMCGLIYETDSSAGIWNVGEGGIYKALWKVAEELGTGIRVYLKMIPIRQEFIEICEYYNINPYMLDGNGSQIIISEHGNRLIRLLTQFDINCAIIGHTTDNNDKIIINKDEIRYIESRIVDEIGKIGGCE